MPVKVKKKPSLKKTYVDLATQSLREEIKVLKATNKQLKSVLKASEKSRYENLHKVKELRSKPFLSIPTPTDVESTVQE